MPHKLACNMVMLIGTCYAVAGHFVAKIGARSTRGVSCRCRPSSTTNPLHYRPRGLTPPGVSDPVGARRVRGPDSSGLSANDPDATLPCPPCRRQDSRSTDVLHQHIEEQPRVH